MKYFIFSPHYAPNVGGIVVLHRLAHMISQLGGEGFIVSPSTFHGSAAKLIEAEFVKEGMVDIDECRHPDAMAIYPEIVLGNPLNCQYVTRWILRDSGNMSYSKKDFIFRYHPRHNLEFNGGRFDGFLNVESYPVQVLTAKRRFFRWKILVMIRKEPRRLMPLTWLVPALDGRKKLSFDEVVDEMSRCLVFVSYDTKTAYSQIASYLGAVSIVIPNKQTSREAFHSVYTAEYGIAYGLFDIYNAIMHRKRLRERLDGLENRNVGQVLDFMNFVKSECGFH